MTPVNGHSGASEVQAQEPAEGTPLKPGAAVFEEWARLVSAAQVEELRALGLDVVEAERAAATVVADGREYIDCISAAGVYNLGRRPPQLMQALREAARVTDQGNFALISREKADLAARLARFVPGDFECAVFSVSRGEAFDFACKLARAATGRPGLVAAQGCWFGQTGFALSLSDRTGKEKYGPLIPDTTLVPFGDLASAEEALTGRTAAFCLELVQAEAGCRVTEGRYLQALRRICDDRGVLLVVDETQTGLGRTGHRFAFQSAGVAPDVVVVGEALAAGAFPICATVFPQRLNDVLNKHPLIHLSTFGGHDVGCVVAQRALEVYERERPWQNAAAMGERLKQGLQTLADTHETLVGGIDGAGLLLAIRLKDEKLAGAFCRGLAEEGVLALPGVVARASVVLRPSLLIGEAEVDRVLAAASAALERVGRDVH
jgi:acetylornithine/succinyldiaminopimelate/putrescine aminotransferase